MNRMVHILLRILDQDTRNRRSSCTPSCIQTEKNKFLKFNLILISEFELKLDYLSLRYFNNDTQNRKMFSVM